MRKYKDKIKEAKVKNSYGEFGKFGFKSNLPYKEYNTIAENIMMSVNSDLMDMEDDNTPVSRELQKIDDYRVDVKNVGGNFAITYPIAVGKNKKLVPYYNRLVQKHLEYNAKFLDQSESFYDNHTKEVIRLQKAIEKFNIAQRNVKEALGNIQTLAGKENYDDLRDKAYNMNTSKNFGNEFSLSKELFDLESLITQER